MIRRNTEGAASVSLGSWECHRHPALIVSTGHNLCEMAESSPATSLSLPVNIFVLSELYQEMSKMNSQTTLFVG